MGKYTSSAVKRAPKKTNAPHYIWQGLGCLMAIIIPMISYAAGQITVDSMLANGFDIPREFLGRPNLPGIITGSSGLYTLFGWAGNVDNFYAILTATVIYIVLLGGFISLLYTFTYRFVAPPRYGLQDMPPPNFKGKKFKR